MSRTTYRFRHAVVVVDDDVHCVETHYEDGSVAYGVPQNTESYLETARSLGYGDDVWQATVDHEIMHTALAELRGEHHSGSLWAQAHKPDGFEFDPSKMPRKGFEEEQRLFAFQRLLNRMRGVDVPVNMPDQ